MALQCPVNVLIGQTQVREDSVIDSARRSVPGGPLHWIGVSRGIKAERGRDSGSPRASFVELGQSGLGPPGWSRF